MPLVFSIYLDKETASSFESILSELQARYKTAVPTGPTEEQIAHAHQIIRNNGGGKIGGAMANAYLKEVQRAQRPPTASNLAARYIKEGIAREQATLATPPTPKKPTPRIVRGQRV